MPKIRLFDFDKTLAPQRAENLRRAGYIVDDRPFEGASMPELRAAPPDAVVISLERRPSQGRDAAVWLRVNKSTRRVPLVLVGGEADKVQALRLLLPDAVYTTWDAILPALAQAIAHPPPDPIVPKSVFDQYKDTPLPKKLGLRPGYRVGLVDAPQGFAATLGELPAGVELLAQPQSACDVTLWFVTSQAAFTAGLPVVAELARPVADLRAGSLWVIWPKKGARISSDLTQPRVRAAGLELGLVDFKICSVDETWTGLCFRWRKK
jgi:hypothetical protein